MHYLQLRESIVVVVAMVSQSNSPLHFVLFPFMAQGHVTPMTDIARLFAQHGVMVTIVMTPTNVTRFGPVLDRAIQSGLPIKVLQVPFPCSEAGLADGCESVDMLPSLGLSPKFFDATEMLLEPVEKLMEGLAQRPDCIVSDVCLPYTGHIADKYGVPRISFNGNGCFTVLCLHQFFNVLKGNIGSEDENASVPGLSDLAEIGNAIISANKYIVSEKFGKQMAKAEESSYGLIINTFEEMEQEYVKAYRKVRQDRVWCIGPVSLCNKNKLDEVQRGNKTSIEENDLAQWLDSRKPAGSVLYVCLGSICNLITSHLIELALGLEESGKPFIWAIRRQEKTKEFEDWILENGYEERIRGRGLLIRGWAPQLLILSHPAIGGFLTHCGWNSTLEGICAGVPLVTLPLFADQFLNEKLVVDILRVGIRVGENNNHLCWGQEEKTEVVAKKEDVRGAIQTLMGEGEESERMRQRARELGNISKGALEKGGSSYADITKLIEEIKQQARMKSPSSVSDVI